ncbi:Protein of unknown function [Pyronema omphalodes CBS 100304]|uniref:Uncharacterized protein n=1 Tax=Pyronema omphalodes (strain CBS 100304) TaxID=1076935 RepID=U4L827_PYROM|nr:Protein of unknown function [Pyronema omphalodes CBS 100304]
MVQPTPVYNELIQDTLSCGCEKSGSRCRCKHSACCRCFRVNARCTSHCHPDKTYLERCCRNNGVEPIPSVWEERPEERCAQEEKRKNSFPETDSHEKKRP